MVDARRAIEIEQEFDETIESTAQYNLTFQQDAMRFLEHLTDTQKEVHKRQAAAALRKAHVCYQAVKSFLETQQQPTTIPPIASSSTTTTESNIQEEEEEGEEEEIVEEEKPTTKKAMRLWTKLIKAIAEMIRNGYDKLFVEIGDFVTKFRSEDEEQIHKTLKEKLEHEEISKTTTKITRSLNRLEAISARGGSVSSMKSIIERNIQPDLNILQQNYSTNAEAMAFVSHVNEVVSRVIPHANEINARKHNQRQQNEMKQLREQVNSIALESDQAKKELEQAIIEAEQKVARQVDSALHLPTFSKPNQSKK